MTTITPSAIPHSPPSRGRVATDWIAVLDYGSQYTHLITRALRELGVYSEVVDGPCSLEQILAAGSGIAPAGIVLSGSPHSVHAHGAPMLHPSVTDADIPVLGICYGFQALAHMLGGSVRAATSTAGGEYGRAQVAIERSGLLGEPGDRLTPVWMSHGEEVVALPPGWTVVARTEAGAIAAAEHPERGLTGLQFHPEVRHTPDGTRFLERWLDRCGCPRMWTAIEVRETLLDQIRAAAGERPVISFVSGGVDSTVATVLAVEALGADRVYPVHVDNGLLRQGESELVCDQLSAAGIDVMCIDARDRFHDALRGVTDPERKRHVIGDAFIEVQEQACRELGLPDDAVLCQGTLYPDMVESGFGVGGRAATMISHHNVGTPLVRAKREANLLLEPLASLYKDEVRELGALLGISRHLLERQPFPGPGLALRILGEVTPRRCELVRRVDAVALEEVRRAGIADTGLWQVFAVLTGARAVGVHGDARSYGEVVAIRAMTSHDGMTADCYRFDWDTLLQISTRITEECREVGKVVYDISSKPPSNVEWE